MPYNIITDEKVVLAVVEAEVEVIAHFPLLWE